MVEAEKSLLDLFTAPPGADEETDTALFSGELTP